MSNGNDRTTWRVREADKPRIRCHGSRWIGGCAAFADAGESVGVSSFYYCDPCYEAMRVGYLAEYGERKQRQYERVAVGWCAAPGTVSAVVVARGDIVDADHDVLRVYHGGHVHDVFWSPGRMLYLFKPAAASGEAWRKCGRCLATGTEMVTDAYFGAFEWLCRGCAAKVRDRAAASEVRHGR